MRRKLLTIILSLAMLAVMMPSASFAATIHPGVSTERSVPKVEKFHGKYVIKDTTSTLEMYKQALYDALDEEYSGAVKDEEEYSEEIWAKINKTYEDEVAHIESVEDENELVTLIWIFMMPNEETVKALLTIDCLSDMTKDKFNADTDYNEKKNDLYTSCESQYFFYAVDDYNDYYMSQIDYDHARCIDSIEEVKDLDTFIDAVVFAKQTELYDPGSDYGTIDIDEDDDFFDDDDWEDWEDESETLLGIENFFQPYTDGYMTKDEIANLKENINHFLDAYVNKQLVISEYSGDVAPLQKMVEDAKAKCVNMEDGDEALGVFFRTLNKMVDITGIDMEEFDPVREAIVEEMEALFATYKEEDYSMLSWGELNYNFMEMEMELDSVCYRAALPIDIIGTVKAVLDATPTLKQQLKELKAEYKNKLGKYVGNVKYNQAKVKPIVAAGKKAINASNDIDELDSIYEDYNIKAKATIKKYKITTAKVGKGTITKTQKVKYGKTFTVKITPKAGYKISKVYIDGKKKKLKNSYTFKNVKKAHKVKVIFTK